MKKKNSILVYQIIDKLITLSRQMCHAIDPKA